MADFSFFKWDIEIHRRAYRRTMTIQLHPRRPIRVLANVNTPKKVIDDFLMSKKDWIEKNLQKFRESATQFPLKRNKAAEDFPFLGKDRKFKVVITLNKRSFVSVTDDNLLLHIPRNDWSADTPSQEHPNAQKEIRDFYKREGVKLLSERIQHWSQQMNLHPKQVRFREQRTRWGSCSSRKMINLNWRLIVFSLELIDYVIVHELAHLEHMNHSEKFWSLVEKYLPNSSELKHRLKESQRLTDFLAAHPRELL